MATSYPDVLVLAVIAVVGVLTYAIRLSFVALFGRLADVPPTLERALRYVPPAVLAALVLPALVSVQPATGTVAVDRLGAGLLAAVVAWRTENVLATMTVGMGALWTIRLFA